MNQKSQLVRLIDVFLLGPFMMWYAALTAEDMPEPTGAVLFVTGLLTILYNGYYWLVNHRAS